MRYTFSNRISISFAIYHLSRLLTTAAQSSNLTISLIFKRATRLLAAINLHSYPSFVFQRTNATAPYPSEDASENSTSDDIPILSGGVIEQQNYKYLIWCISFEMLIQFSFRYRVIPIKFW